MKKLFLFTFLFSISFLHSQIPYQSPFKQIKTKHFHILYPSNQKEMAEKTAIYSEEIFENLHQFMKWKPLLRITIVITDHTDEANGLAFAHYRNTIHLQTSSVHNIDGLRDTENPLYSLILHEMTHILHLDQIRGAAYFWHIISGRLYFPVSGAFPWFYEGIAVHNESTMIEGGRLTNAYGKAMLRDMVKNDSIPTFHNFVNPVVEWPFGEVHYYLGGYFTKFLIDTYGYDTYMEFNRDLSNDFWPFIYEFMLKFRKVYGKSLNTLWDEWKTSLYETIEIDNKTNPIPLFETKGTIGYSGILNDQLYISYSNYKESSGLYKIDKQGKPTLITRGFYNSLTSYKNDLLCTYSQTFPGDKIYSDIYLLRGSNKKRLTFGKRYTLVNYSENIGAALRNENIDIFTIKKNHIQILKTIDASIFENIIDMDMNGSLLLVSGKLKDGTNYSIATIDVETENISILTNIRGKKPNFIDNSTFTFVGKNEDRLDRPYEYTLEDNSFREIAIPLNYSKDAFVHKNMVYVVSLFDGGNSLFNFTLNYNEETNADWLNYQTKTQIEIPIDLKEKIYNPFAFLYPLYWYPLPVFLNSSFTIFNNLNFNYPTISLVFGGFEPLERFRYEISVALDYIKWYPETNVLLNFHLPCLKIDYLFNTYKGIEYKPNQFTTNLINSISISPYFTFDNSHTLQTPVRAISFLSFGDYHLNSSSTELIGGLGYNFSIPVNYGTLRNFRFNTSALLSAFFIPYFQPELNLVATVGFSIPIISHAFFLQTKVGYNFFSKESFSIGSQNVSLNSSGNSLKTLDYKGISFSLHDLVNSNAYIYNTLGFDITVFRKSFYFQFLTSGFKGVYLKPFSEQVIGFSDSMFYLVDLGVESILDFFLYYGNINLRVSQGFVLHYGLGNSAPEFNAYIYLSAGL